MDTLTRINGKTNVKDFPVIYNANLTKLTNEITRLNNVITQKDARISELERTLSTLESTLTANFAEWFDVKMEEFEDSFEDKFVKKTN